MLSAAFAGGYFIHEYRTWDEEKLSAADQAAMGRFLAPDTAEPWEYHYKEHFIAKVNRNRHNVKSWTGVEESWFTQAHANEMWPGYMNQYPSGKTGNILRDNRLNRNDVLYWFEYSNDANLHVYAANMEGDNFSANAHPDFYDAANNPGPIWNYWWQVDKDWIHIPKNKSKQGELANAKPALERCTPEFRRQNPTADRFPLTCVSRLKQAVQWQFYGFNQKRKGDYVELEHRGNLHVKIQNGRAKAFTELHGRLVWLTYIFVQNKENMFGYVPQWFLFIGQDVLTGKRIIEYRDSSGNREKAGSTSKNSTFYSKKELTEFKRRWDAQDFPKV